MLAVSESFVLGVDIVEQGSAPVISVCRYNGTVLELVNVITDYKAQELYDTLICKLKK